MNPSTESSSKNIRVVSEISHHREKCETDDEDGSLVGGKKYLNVVHGDDKISFDSIRRGFIPHVCINAKITEAKKYNDASKFSISPYIYTIELLYGDRHRWTIKRRYKDFLKLHSKVTVTHKRQTLLHSKSGDRDDAKLSVQNQTPIIESKIYQNQLHSCTPKQQKQYGSFGNTSNSTPSTRDFDDRNLNGSTSTAFHTAESTCHSSAQTSQMGSSHLNPDKVQITDSLTPSQHDNDHSEAESDELENRERKSKKFPKKPDSMLPENDQGALEKRRLRLEGYLDQLLQLEEYRNHPEMLEFLEVSEFSFIDGLSEKDKEGMVKKRSGDDSQNRRWYNLVLGALRKTICLVCLTSFRWGNMWCIVQDTSILGLDPKTGEIHVVLLFDKEFKIEADRSETGVRKCIRVSNLSRQLWIKISAQERFFEWKESIERSMKAYPGEDFITSNVHESFAPIRKNQRAYWFVDGESLMSAVADVIEQAKEEIFITDWWLSPEIYLKRGVEYDPKYRLLTLLKKKAREGVKVFILLYKELELALALNSLYTKKTLMKGGQNIKVLRHPDRASGSTKNELLWAHHEKLVVVDQIYAFVGGIDLCYGRWDNHNHHLTDLDVTKTSPSKTEQNKTGSDETDGANIVKEEPSPYRPISTSLFGFGGPNTSSRPQARNAGNQSIMHMLAMAHEVSLAPMRSETDSNEKNQTKPSDANCDEIVKGIKEGKRTSRLRNAVYKAKEKLKRDSSRSSCSSEDSENISTSWEEDDLRESKDYLSCSKDTSNKGSDNGLNNKKDKKIQRTFSQQTRRKIKKKLTSVTPGRKKSSNTEPPNLRKSTPPAIMVHGPSQSSDLGIENGGFSTSPSIDIVDASLVNRSPDQNRKESTGSFHPSPVEEAVKQVIESSAGIAGGLLWRGKDYVNFIVKDVARPDQPEDDNVDRRTTPRMPWHDISLMVQGYSARDVARHFIQRWNAIKTEKAKFHKRYPFLLPKSYKDSGTAAEIPPPVIKSNLPSANVNCQVLRSCSKWSAGIDGVEDSIYRAYISAIKSAEHYVYIENQFFITNSGQAASPTSGSNVENAFSMPQFAAEAGTFLQETFNMGDVNYGSTGSDIVKNRLGQALVDRITRAHKEKKKFRVFILVPLLPAFEGQVEDASTGNALRVILHYNYASMSRGPNSLFSRLTANGINPMNYISFASLRTYSELCGSPVTELVYIHSKLMIVDDRIVICGSANINDRSLNGSRDSEVCLRIEDTEFDENCLMNKQKFKSGKFAGSLRRRLMREHLGLLPKVIDEVAASAPDHDKRAQSLSDAIIDQPVDDCCSDEFYKDVWIKTASFNTKLFEEAFGCSPTDTVKTLTELQEYNNKPVKSQFDRYGTNQVLNQIKGNLVLLPLQFLSDENLLPSYLSKEGWVPAETWT